MPIDHLTKVVNFRGESGTIVSRSGGTLHSKFNVIDPSTITETLTPFKYVNNPNRMPIKNRIDGFESIVEEEIVVGLDVVLKSKQVSPIDFDEVILADSSRWVVIYVQDAEFAGSQSRMVGLGPLTPTS